jgi:hypothetical protein
MAAELGWYNACICCISPFEEDDIVDPFFLRQDRKFGRTGFFCQEVDGGGGGGGGGVQANAVSASAGDEKADEDEDEEALRNIIAVGQSRFELAGKEVPPQDDVEYFSERVINICGLNHGNMPKRTGMTLNGTNCYLVGTGKKVRNLPTELQPTSTSLTPAACRCAAHPHRHGLWRAGPRGELRHLHREPRGCAREGGLHDRAHPPHAQP